MTTTKADPGPARPIHQIKPFASAERAWLWTAGCLAARRAGTPLPHDRSRPCTPETILTCLDRLYRARRIDLVHARVLRVWGDRGRAPDRRSGSDRSDWRQWRYALAELEQALRARGIVAGFDLGMPVVPEKNFPNDRITFLFSTQPSSTVDPKEI
ncbi:MULTISPECIES: hypothetical protein [Acidiphilium]|uniref:hypothetical protein n=1 Tax=Acidiphilium TaxID=522 RepID=UPI00258003D7|nr:MULTISPECIES: hypothetical protein [Acidiphilium]HQT84051.1 hypothetical protein [Acidiphilium rubrum]